MYLSFAGEYASKFATKAKLGYQLEVEISEQQKTIG